MEKFEMNDLDNCFVCGEYMGTFKNELQVNTAYSEKTVLEIIGKTQNIKNFSFLIILISEKFIHSQVPEIVANNGGICQNCFIKFNEYDEFYSRAEAIQSEIFMMLTSSHPEPSPEKYIECKEEPNIDEHQQIIYTEYDENMVEVMPDQLIEPYTITEVHPMIKSPVKPKKEPINKSPVKHRSYNTKNDKDEGYIITMIDGVKNYTCEMCGKNFVSRSRLRTHRMTHSTVRNFLCKECGANFKTANCLKNHSRLHLNIFYFCDICGNKFKGKHELRCHIDAVHLKKKDHIW